MRIGDLQHVITIQRRVQVGRTSISEPNWVWQDWRPGVWAGITVKRGKEQWDPQTKQRYSEEVYHFKVYYEEVIGADDTMRVAHEGNIFKIRSILPDAQCRSDAIIECVLESQSVERAPMTVAIEDEILPGYLGEPFEAFTVKAGGGASPYSFSAGSTLPPGLSIDASGVVSGTPTSAGVYSVVITVTDNNGEAETLPAFDIEVT
jgi:head-tail adaptor